MVAFLVYFVPLYRYFTITATQLMSASFSQLCFCCRVLKIHMLGYCLSWWNLFRWPNSSSCSFENCSLIQWSGAELTHTTAVIGWLFLQVTFSKLWAGLSEILCETKFWSEVCWILQYSTDSQPVVVAVLLFFYLSELIVNIFQDMC